MARHQKKARRLRATIVFADEVGFSLVPPVGKTWSRRGITPIVRHPFRWPKFSAIAGVTTRRQLIFLVHKGTIRADQCRKFILHILRHVKGPVILIWDNNKPHKGLKVQEIELAAEGRLTIEYLPPYSPQLNPPEFVFAHLKKDELANSCHKTLPDLQHELRRAVMRTRMRPKLMEGFLKAPGLSLTGLLN